MFEITASEIVVVFLFLFCLICFDLVAKIGPIFAANKGLQYLAFVTWRTCFWILRIDKPTQLRQWHAAIKNSVSIGQGHKYLTTRIAFLLQYLLLN